MNKEQNKNEQGTCPVCNGSMVTEGGRACFNCGGQYMFGRPTGLTYLRADGTPCRHEHQHRTIGRCLHEYQCKHCADSFIIDSGD